MGEAAGSQFHGRVGVGGSRANAEGGDGAPTMVGTLPNSPPSSLSYILPPPLLLLLLPTLTFPFLLLQPASLLHSKQRMGV